LAGSGIPQANQSGKRRKGTGTWQRNLWNVCVNKMWRERNKQIDRETGKETDRQMDG